MKRVAAAWFLLVAALSLTACGGSSGKSSKASSAHPVKLPVWAGWSASTHELKASKGVVAEYDRKHPEVFTSSNVGKYCPTGAWIDLAPYLKKDKISLADFTKTPLYYTQYKGKRCALPLLADTFGLYYNKAMFKAAGITSPPKTMSQLTADAQKLTQKNPDGSLKVVGFDPSPPSSAATTPTRRAIRSSRRIRPGPSPCSG